MNITIHLTGKNDKCFHCGAAIPKPPTEKGEWGLGRRIGVVTSKWANPVAYSASDSDTAPSCSASATEDQPSGTGTASQG